MLRKRISASSPPLRISEATWNSQHLAGRAKLVREAAVLGYRLTIACEGDGERTPDPSEWGMREAPAGRR